jgi:hypothetical protein
VAVRRRLPAGACTRPLVPTRPHPHHRASSPSPGQAPSPIPQNPRPCSPQSLQSPCLPKTPQHHQHPPPPPAPPATPQRRHPPVLRSTSSTAVYATASNSPRAASMESCGGMACRPAEEWGRGGAAAGCQQQGAAGQGRALAATGRSLAAASWAGSIGPLLPAGHASMPAWRTQWQLQAAGRCWWLRLTAAHMGGYRSRRPGQSASAPCPGRCRSPR